MTDIIIRIFTYLRQHRMVGLLAFIVTTALLVASVMRLNYKEDIADFLPLDDNHQNALAVYQDIAGASKVFAVFQYRDTTKADPDNMVAAIESFVTDIADRDTSGMARSLTAQVDIQKLSEITDFVYGNIPYFLTAADYRRIDSLLQTDGYVARQLQQDKQMLMFPSGGILADNIQRDPLNLFTPVVEKLQHTDSGLKYEMYDGYIFSPDMQRAIVMVDSPFGASETEHNTRLISLLRSGGDKVAKDFKNIEVHVIGGPVIAVGNATQIKTDSILSVGIAVALILALLFLSFRSWRNLMLIAVSIGWGWLFAMGCLALVHDNVSIIVIGISSVIVGIAVNYPLHFIAHLSHTPDKKRALREIVMPLVVGNITTVGAFLALVPLQSVAMRDLGLFASFLLIGTILFVLLFLPHLTKVRHQEEKTIFNKLGDVSLENKPWLVAIVAVLTLVFAYYSFDTAFDTNMGHINYMTDEQKADMAYFQRMMTNSGDEQKVYAVSTASSIDKALDGSGNMQQRIDSLQRVGLVSRHAGCKQFLSSEKEQNERLKMWREFVGKYRDGIIAALYAEGQREGFSADSFDDFRQLLDATYEPQLAAHFSLLAKSAFSSNLSTDSVAGRYSVVDVLSVKQKDIQRVENLLNASGTCHSFDVQSMNSALANNLSDDFNYIGWACGCIVFFFLWLSLGSIELAILSFVPMAVSWVWILGIMSLLGIQFNIVNIILATFIFGQGDDYTIFMTEGSCYEYAYRRKMLASYKNSIIISALIMFIGIGTLIVAKHPALHSLAEVTIAGMFSVVLMAYLFPPLIFNFLVRSGSHYRLRPVSLLPLLAMAWSAMVFFSQLLTVYVYGFLLFVASRKTEKKTLAFRRYIRRLFTWDLNHIPGVRLHVYNPHGDDAFAHPSVVVSNHQSMLDAAAFMSLSERLILVSNNNPSSNIFVRLIFRWMGHVCLSGNADNDVAMLRCRVEQGYSLVVFPEGERNDRSSILRFHKGAFYLAELLGLDITPVFLHGFNHVLPRRSACAYKGRLTVVVRQRICISDGSWGKGYAEHTRRIHEFYVSEYRKLAASIETADYLLPIVRDRFRYKGVEIYSEVTGNLRQHAGYAEELKAMAGKPEITLRDTGYGEFALLCALTYPSADITVVEPDADRAAVLRNCADGIVGNIKIISSPA